MIRITVTQAAYRAIQASLPPNSTTDSDPEAATVRLWLDLKTVDALSRLRWPGGDLSDVILRLAQLEECLRSLTKSRNWSASSIAMALPFLALLGPKTTTEGSWHLGGDSDSSLSSSEDCTHTLDDKQKQAEKKQ
jgi:hypothetical protein